MSAVSLLRLLSLTAATGGGIAIDHYLIPHRDSARAAAAEHGGESFAAATMEKGSVSGAAGGKPFAGSIADLLRIARQAGDYEIAQARLIIALTDTRAADLQRLTMAFQWRQSANWPENAVYAVLLLRWGETDTDAAMKWCATLPSARVWQSRWRIISAVARQHPDKALALAGAIRNAGQRQSTLASLIGVIAATDPHRAFSVYQSMGKNGRSGDYLLSLFSTWAGNDPAEAFAAAQLLGKTGERNQALYGVLNAWASTDPAAAYVAALAIPEGNSRTLALQSVYAAWAGVDPQAAHAAVSALPESRARNQAMNNVIRAWASKDPRGALTVSLALSNRTERLNAMDSVFGTWAADDPQAAAAAAGSAGFSRNDKMRATGQIAQTWAQADAPAALAWARTLPAKEGGDNAVANALGSLARTDGPAAAAAWQELSPQQKRMQVRNIVDSWAWQDRDAATQWARSLENPQDRAAALGSCLGGLELTETDKITSLLNELPAGPARVNAIRSVVGQHVGSDPEGTMHWLLTLTETERSAALHDGNYTWELASGDPRQMASLLRETPALGAQNYRWGNIAERLAGEDPAAALAWVDSLETPGARKQSTDQVMRVWATENAPEALAKAQGLTDPAQQKSAIRTVLETWAGSDPDAVLAWAATASGEQREVALLYGSLQKAENDPAASAGIVTQLLAQNPATETPAHLSNAAASVARAWFQQDVTKAAQWAAQLPDGNAQENAVSTIARDWTSLDPLAASQWVQQLPPGDSRDIAAQALSQGITQSDPSSAFTWAASIGDPAKRDEAVRSAAESWRWQDREAARAAVMQAPISESVRTSLLQEMAKGE